MAEINRREFITAAAATAAACAVCHCHDAQAQAAAPSTMPAATSVDVGAKADYAADGMHDKFIATNHIVITRENGKIFASSSKCTHQGADVQIQGDALFCPRHKSMFTPEGIRTAGPAKTALPRYAIKANSDGHLIVDLTQQFPQEKWTDPASFVTV
jgi:nitrite reductase/ring-hydroxylating ferredoxin subunit